VVEGEQRIVRSDTGAVLGTFKEGYRIHQYEEWLLNNVATILDDDLASPRRGCSRGCRRLGGGLRARHHRDPGGLRLPAQPAGLHLVSTARSPPPYARTVTATVCDNTLSGALQEDGQKIKFKHSRYSAVKVGQAREALAMVYTLADDFAAQISALAATEVNDKQWAQFLDAHVLPFEGKTQLTWHQLKEKGGRSLTMAQNKRDGLHKLYRHDNRVAPWAGTALGVVQAVNTFTHHEGIVRGASRTERNMLSTIEGKFDTLDRDTFATLNKVLALSM
jgi:hypothetical protein